MSRNTATGPGMQPWPQKSIASELRSLLLTCPSCYFRHNLMPFFFICLRARFLSRWCSRSSQVLLSMVAQQNLPSVALSKVVQQNLPSVALSKVVQQNFPSVSPSKVVHQNPQVFLPSRWCSTTSQVFLPPRQYSRTSRVLLSPRWRSFYLPSVTPAKVVQQNLPRGLASEITF